MSYRPLKALAFLLIVGQLAYAQAATTNVEGHIVDLHGGTVSHAEAALRNVLTGVARQYITGDDGSFKFLDIAPGEYVLTGRAPGLATQTQSIQVKAGAQTLKFELSLPISSARQSVTVVSGSRVEELQQDSPLPIDVLTRQGIQRTGYESVADALGEIPGVVTRNNASFSGASQQQIDGIASQDILVLQDGLPIVGARGIKSGIIDLDQQNIGKLDRIEVVRGASSSLYGTDAVGGAINMITHEPTQPFEGGVRISGGSLGALDSAVNLGTTWRKLTAFVDLESHHVGSYTLIPNNESTVGADSQLFDGFAKLRYHFDPKFSLGFSASAYHNEATGKTTDSTGTAESGYDRAKSHDSTQTYALTAEFLPTSTTAIQARAYESRYDESSYQSPLDTAGNTGDQFGYGDLHERYHRFDATISQQVGSRQLLQGGDEWTQDQYRGLNRLVGDDAGQQATTNDVWFQDRIQATRNLLFTLGGRYNHHSLYGSHVVPKVGVVYRLNDHWSVRGAYGKGFRSPSLGELYYRLQHPEYFYQVIGNPTLQPETSESYSVGGDYQSNRFSIGVTLYRNNLNHLINYVFAGFPVSATQLQMLLARYGVPPSFGAQPFLATYIYTNTDKAYTQGVNIRGSIVLTHDLRVDGAYAYLDPYDRVNHQTLTERSRNQGYFKLEYFSRRWGLILNTRANFFGRWLIDSAQGTHEPAYAIWKLYGSKDITHGLQLYAAVDNLADSRDHLLSQDPPTYDRTDYGRTFRAGMRYTFPRN
jgi:outer membrane receptor for ferrienterochelin and colicins